MLTRAAFALAVATALGAVAMPGATELSRAVRAMPFDSIAPLLVIPPVIASGWSAPSVATRFSLRLASGAPNVVVRGARVVSTARRSVTARLTATLVDAERPAATVTKTFVVTLLPATDTRYVLAYTRTATDRTAYGGPLANSMHLALGATPTHFRALNENYGILFPTAVPTARLDVNAIRTLRSPTLFSLADGSYGVVATRALPDLGPRTRDRHTALRRVHWAADSLPVLDMTPTEEIAPALRRVTATLTVHAASPHCPPLRRTDRDGRPR